MRYMQPPPRGNDRIGQTLHEYLGRETLTSKIFHSEILG